MNLNTCHLLNASEVLCVEEMKSSQQQVEKRALLSGSSTSALHWQTWTLSLGRERGAAFLAHKGHSAMVVTATAFFSV